MYVLLIYVVLVSVLEVGVYFIGLVIDRIVPDGFDLIAAMAMFFGVIYGMWPVTVYIAERWFPEAPAADAGTK